MTGLLTAQTGKPYAIGLSLAPAAGYVHLAGELDLQARTSLTRLFASLEVLSAPIRLDMDDVTFIDSTAATALVEADRRRRHLGLPPLQVDTCSATVAHFFAATGIGAQPYFDLEGWAGYEADQSSTSAN